MTDILKLICFVVGGFLSQEWLYWYNLRFKLSSTRYRKILRSPGYWFAVCGMAALAVIGTYAWYSGDPANHHTKDYFFMGVSWPLLIKQISKSVTAKGAPELGDEDSTWSDYLS
ncbi:MAG TPA: hypothetical protein PLK30_25660 [Blastocatellia bacterium]|nr:hypothetical protein [Blastocatellia bacterium]